MFPLPINIYFEIAALITALIFRKNLKKSSFYLIVFFLFIIVSAELFGRFLTKELNQPNAWLYNFVVPFEYIFWALIFFKHYKSKNTKLIAKLFLVCFSIYTLNWLILNGVFDFNENFLVIGSFSMFFLSVIMFFELYYFDEETVIWKLPIFWLTTGVFLFNAGESSYNLLTKFLLINNIDPTYKLFISINSKLILVLYTSIIIAIVCQKISGTYKEV